MVLIINPTITLGYYIYIYNYIYNYIYIIYNYIYIIHIVGPQKRELS